MTTPLAYAEEAKRHLFAGKGAPAVAAAKSALQIDMGTTDALLVLATLGCNQGSFKQAAEFVQQALKAGGADAWAHAIQGRIMLAHGVFAEARRAAHLAATVSPESVEPFVADTIGVVLAQCGLHSKTPPFFRRAVSGEIVRNSFRANLGFSLRVNGQLDACRECYHELLKQDTQHAQAHLALTMLDKQTSENNALDTLERLLARPDIPPVDASAIGHAIAKTYEDLGEWDAAFDALERGKAPMAAQSNFDADRQSKLFNAAAASTRHHDKPGGDENEAPIFILGLPRSGTTLVERILSSHSQMVTAGELPDFGSAYNIAAGKTGRYFLDIASLEGAAAIDPAKLGSLYLESARQAIPGTDRFIDKMPLNYFYVPMILMALPKARVICLRRNPADSLLSNMRANFSSELSEYNYVYRLKDTATTVSRFYQLIDHYAQALPADRYCEVQYETLVADQENVTRRLLDFCGLPFEEACLAPEKNEGFVATASALQVRKPVFTTSMDRWKRYERAAPRIIAALKAEGIEVEA